MAPAVENGHPELIRTVFGNRYRVDEVIESSGPSRLCRAWDDQLNRSVLVEVLWEGHDRSGRLRTMFVERAQSLAQLNHPNIVTIHDFGRQDSLDFAVMEDCIGESLTEISARAGGLYFEDFWPLMVPIVAALSAVHERRIVYGELTASNIMVTTSQGGQTKHLKIARFPLVPRRYSSEVERLCAIAPEVKAGHAATMRSDVYALGIIFFDALTLEGVDGLDDYSSADPPTLQEIGLAVPDAIEELIDDCISRIPMFRPSSAREVLQSLRQYVRDNDARRIALEGRRDAGKQRRQAARGVVS